MIGQDPQLSRMAQPASAASQLPSPIPSEVYSYEQTANTDIDLAMMISVFYRRRWLMLVTFALVFVVGMVATFLQRKVYQATGSILVAGSQSQHGDSLPLLEDLQAITQSRSVDTQVEILISPGLRHDAMRNMKLQATDGDLPEVDNTDKIIMSVAARKNTDIITITVNAPSPKTATAFVNSVIETYKQRNLEENQLATHQACIYVGEQLEKERKKFQRANRELALFKQRTGLVAPDEQMKDIVQSISAARLALDSARDELVSNQHSLNVVKKQISAMQVNIISGTKISRNPQIAEIVQSIDTLYADRAQQCQEFTAQSPEVRATDARIKAEEARLQKLTANIVAEETQSRNPVRDTLLQAYATGLAAAAAGQVKVRALAAELVQRKAALQLLPDQARQLTELLEGLDAEAKTLDMLTARYHELQITERGTLSNVRVVSEAQGSLVPVSPRPKRNAILFLVLGIFSGVALVLLAERLDDRVHDQESAEKLTGLVTLGTIHEVEEGEATIIDVNDKNSMLSERFRVLRNNISFSSLDRTQKILAITSTGPGEGKSTTCANLAIVMGMDGKRVLVVGCDLHRPSIHTLLKQSRNTGFTDVLMGKAELENAIVQTEFENVAFLPTGTLPPNPAEVLNAQHTRQFFKSLAEQYDLVILDCPPCAKLSDVQVIATIVDGMIILVAANRASRHGLAFTYRALAQVTAPLIGIIVNRLDLRQYRYGGYYGYGGYYYGTYGYFGQYGSHEDGSPTEVKHQKTKGRKSLKHQRETSEKA